MDRRSFSLEKALRLFWEKVPHRPKGACWEWQGKRLPDGHGQLRRNYKLRYAHRTAYEDAKGPIPDGLVVRHTCDNPSCVNLEHLVLGTQAENVRDMILRGRMPRGTSRAHAKLNDDAVRAIRAARGVLSQKVLATIYGVGESVVSAVQLGKIWTHVPA